MLARIPGALIHRLFLTPCYFFDVLIFQETALEVFMRKGIQLLQANYCDILNFSLSPLASSPELSASRPFALALASAAAAVVPAVAAALVAAVRPSRYGKKSTAMT